MAPLEPWEKVLLSSPDYFETAHGKTPCTICHLGDLDAPDKEIAHQGIVTRPSEEDNTYCAPCHADITANFRGSSACFSGGLLGDPCCKSWY